MNRFYLPPGQWSGEQWIMEGDEARHCTGVLRHKPGDTIMVFDGEGNGAAVEIASTERHRVYLQAPRLIQGPPGSGVGIAFAIPKGKVLDTILQKGTELGVDAFYPLITARTIARPAGDDAPGKWRKILIEACKQCGRNKIPDLFPVQTLEAFLDHLPSHSIKAFGALQEGALPLHRWWPAVHPTDNKIPGEALALIGPEGDLTDQEAGALRDAGFMPWDFGPIIMRCDTAVLFAASALAVQRQRSAHG